MTVYKSSEISAKPSQHFTVEESPALKAEAGISRKQPVGSEYFDSSNV